LHVREGRAQSHRSKGKLAGMDGHGGNDGGTMTKRAPRHSLPSEIISDPVDEAALKFAREKFQFFRKTGNPWSKDSPFTAAAGHALSQWFLALGWQDVITRMQLVMLARAGVRDAQAVLRRIILEHQTRGEALPTEVAAYDMEVKTFGPAPAQWAGPRTAHKLNRDICILAIGMLVADKFRLPRTKNPSSRRRSTSEIIALALESVGVSIGHKGIEKIFGRWRNVWIDASGWTESLEQEKSKDH
jgi:hypothetical protein